MEVSEVVKKSNSGFEYIEGSNEAVVFNGLIDAPVAASILWKVSCLSPSSNCKKSMDS